MHTSVFLSLLFPVSLLGVVIEGFVFPICAGTKKHHTSKFENGQQRRQLLLKSSKDDEIAKLEEQLRKLKEEAESESEEQKSSSTVLQEIQPFNPDSFVGRGPAKRPIQPMEEMLSEAWKEQVEPQELRSSTSSQQNGGLSIPAILGGVALVLFLGFFSQVPVGQEDLSKYQAIKASTQIDLGDINPIRSGDF